MMWYEGGETRYTYLQDMVFISEDQCQQYLFDNKVTLVTSLIEKFKNLDDMTMLSFEHYCEGRAVPLESV